MTPDQAIRAGGLILDVLELVLPFLPQPMREQAALPFEVLRKNLTPDAVSRAEAEAEALEREKFGTP